MIDNIANLLKGILEEEKKKLNNYELKHGPTIGKMYEGLTNETLKKAIPINLNLKFVNGIIINDNGDMTGEIDCMLVSGEGEKIPYTDSYKWHIKDVIAIIEVKKTLYKNELFDSFKHLKKVQENYTSYIKSESYKKTIDIRSALRAFSESTGIKAPKYKDSDKLTPEQSIVYNTYITEQHSPIRIILGYDGYKSEYSFREALADFITCHTNIKGYDIVSFPQVIISGKYSLVKMNGQPFTSISQDENWDFYVSSKTNPILILLEILWTKLARTYDLDEDWGNDLTRESFNPFLYGKVIKQSNSYGWGLNYYVMNNEQLNKVPDQTEWEPTYVTENQFMIFNKLCENKAIYTNDKNLITYLKKENEDPINFFNSLTKTGLISIDNNNKLCLTTEKCQPAVLPNGKFAVAENNTSLFTRWIEKNFLSNI